jgi:uncharacterized membrane protein
MNGKHTSRRRSGTERGESERTSAGARRRRAERFASATVGGALVVDGLRRRSLSGTAIALVGGGLLVGGLRGTSRLTQALGPRTVDRDERDGTGAPEASRSVTVDRPADELHDVWRDPEKLSTILGHVADVTPLDGDRFRWSVDGPFGREISWETHVVDEEPGERLRWATPSDAMLPNGGSGRTHTARAPSPLPTG